MDETFGIISVDAVTKNVWIAGLLLFMLLFVFILSKTGNLSKTLRYSVFVAVLILVGVGTVMLSTSNTGIILGTSADASAEPKNLQIEQTGDQEMTVRWQTDVESSEIIYYGADDESLMGADQHNLDLVREHVSKLSNLQQGIPYHFKIVNGDQTYTHAENKQFDFIVN